jgi:hypothetical protein
VAAPSNEPHVLLINADGAIIKATIVYVKTLAITCVVRFVGTDLIKMGYKAIAASAAINNAESNSIYLLNIFYVS